MTYHIGDPFDQVWSKAIAEKPDFVLLLDNAFPLPKNLYRLLGELMLSNQAVDGLTLDIPALSAVYGFPAHNDRRSPYSARKLPALPSWLAFLRPARLEDSACLTPEFFLLEKAADKQFFGINVSDINFDTFRWAGDLITRTLPLLASDYKRIGEDASLVPPQFRITIPGQGRQKTPLPPTHIAPSFSIICPCFRPDFLVEAIESVLAQTYPDWELWIGVDGPKEAARQKIAEVAEPYRNDPRIHLLFCEHMGTGPMRRFLSQQGTSDYIVGLDDDDRLMPNTLEVFARAIMTAPDTLVLRAGIKLFGLLDAQLPARTRYQINGISNDLFEANQPYAVKRTALEAIGGLEWDKDLKNAGEDSDLLLKADREYLKLTVLNEPLYERRLSTYNQTLDCTAEECLQHVHNLYDKHNPADWRLKEVDLSGQGAAIHMLTRHETPDKALQIVCATEFMDFQQVGSRDGVILDLEITSLCNADCVFCPRDKLVRTNRFMSLDTVAKIAASLQGSRSPTVVLCGIGESTLHPELTRIITMLSGAGANVCMTTNGWTLSPAYVDSLVAAGLSELNVSLNAATAATHQHIMRLKHFDAICSACEEIARLRSHRWPSLKFHVSFVITSDNIEEVQEFVGRWRPTDVSMVWLHRLTNRAGHLAAHCSPVDIESVASTYADDPKVLVDMFPGTTAISNLCHIVKQIDFISVDGDMLLCAQDYSREHAFGNIACEDLNTLHHNKLLRHLRGQTAATCSRCSFCPEGFKNTAAGHQLFSQEKQHKDGVELISG
jgi:MoaA/NifB/PqqE/SkfB family radical SAM enzyme